jgi:ABC-type antimicrobial peptide transport system permease subunit
MSDQDRLWHLMGRKLAGEATEDELRELEQLLQQYPDASYSLQLFNDLWKPVEPKQENEEALSAFDRHRQRMGQKETEKLITGSLTKPTSTFSNAEPAHNNRRLLSYLTGNGMLKNYWKITWRNLARNKSFSFINIIGLAIGMASAVFILLWIENELTYDQFHQKKDRLYQALSRNIFDGQVSVWNSTPMVMTPVLKTEHKDQIEEVARVNWVAAFILKTGDMRVQTAGYVADPGFLTMFDLPLLKGDPKTALSAEHSIVLSEKTARKMFGTIDVLGKVIRIDSTALFTVTGVTKKLPNNTRFEFEYIIPWSYMKEVGWDNPDWGISSIVQTYVLLKPGVTEKAADDRIVNIVKAHDKTASTQIFLHPLRKWRLYSRFDEGKNTGGYIETVRLFGFIAAFILLIACINYMNLSTARSVKRAREVGIRKVAGAQKISLIGQFLGESIVISFFAGMVALVIVTVTLGGFNTLVKKELFVPYGSPYFWICAVGFILVTGILAGSYPAFYLSAFKPVHVLKGSFKAVRTLITPRKMLVVLQFTFAIVLIISTIVIYHQIVFAQKRDTGFDRNNLVYVYNKGDVEKNYGRIREELLQRKLVTSITRTNSPITEIWDTEESYQWEGQDKNIHSFFIKFYSDKDMVSTMGLKLLSGREIDVTRYPADTSAIMLSESAVKAMGFKNALGQQIKNPEGTWHVVGVFRNFIPGIPYEPNYPMTVQGPVAKKWFGTVTFRLTPNNDTATTMAKVVAVFKKHNPDYPVDYFTVNDSYDSKFNYERHTGKLAALFAGLTIFISCLGLFALAAYTTENRIKEIGIRKVFGASIPGITTLLSKDFLKLVLISFLIASPLAWWAMHSWLQGFAYRVTISWWVFAVTGLLSLSIAIITVGYQAVKAALAKPVTALRTE